jgi:hypothetical protein
VCDWFLGEQVVFEFFRECWIFAPNPLQNHGGMFFFLVAIVHKDCLEFFILANIRTLVVLTCSPFSVPA